MTNQALAKNLGIKGPHSPLDLIEAIRHGLPKRALERPATALRVKILDLEHILPVSRRTLEVFADEEQALAWLEAPVEITPFRFQQVIWP